MGLISGLLTLPLAPVRGVAWIAEILHEQALAEFYDENTIRRALTELELAREAGQLDEDEYERQADLLLERLQEVRDAQAAQ